MRKSRTTNKRLEYLGEIPEFGRLESWFRKNLHQAFPFLGKRSLSFAVNPSGSSAIIDLVLFRFVAGGLAGAAFARSREFGQAGITPGHNEVWLCRRSVRVVTGITGNLLLAHVKRMAFLRRPLIEPAVTFDFFFAPPSA